MDLPSVSIVDFEQVNVAGYKLSLKENRIRNMG